MDYQLITGQMCSANTEGTLLTFPEETATWDFSWNCLPHHLLNEVQYWHFLHRFPCQLCDIWLFGLLDVWLFISHSVALAAPSFHTGQEAYNQIMRTLRVAPHSYCAAVGESWNDQQQPANQTGAESACHTFWCLWGLDSTPVSDQGESCDVSLISKLLLNLIITGPVSATCGWSPLLSLIMYLIPCKDHHHCNYYKSK